MPRRTIGAKLALRRTSPAASGSARGCTRCSAGQSPVCTIARQCLDICTEHGLGDFDLAFAYEALARGHAIAGDSEAAARFSQRARAAAAKIAEDEDRALLLADLSTIPGPQPS
jgi:hypothetical protein